MGKYIGLKSVNSTAILTGDFINSHILRSLFRLVLVLYTNLKAIYDASAAQSNQITHN